MFDHCKKNVWPLCKGTKTLFVPVIRNIFPPVSNNHGHFILGSITMLYLCTQNFNASAMDVRGGWLNFFLNYCFPFLRLLGSFCNHQIGSFTKWAVFYFLQSNFIRLCLFCTRNKDKFISIVNHWDLKHNYDLKTILYVLTLIARVKSNGLSNIVEN